MKKDLGVLPAVFPMPVLIVATYDENEKINVMNCGWAQVCDNDKIILYIGETKKTFKNIEKCRAFTVSLADEAHIAEADFVGIASGNTMEDKFERTGFHAVPSTRVHAPLLEDFAVSMECELLEIIPGAYVSGVVGKVINTRADESVLDENGKIEPSKLHAVMFDYFKKGYYSVGPKVAQAWNAGTGLMKK